MGGWNGAEGGLKREDGTEDQEARASRVRCSHGGRRKRGHVTWPSQEGGTSPLDAATGSPSLNMQRGLHHLPT